MEATLPLPLLLLLAFTLLVAFLLAMLNQMSRGLRPSSSPPRITGAKPLSMIRASLGIASNSHRVAQYLSDLVLDSPTHTIHLRHPFMPELIVTAHRDNVEHILKTRFHAYPKGPLMVNTLHDLLGSGIFNSDGDTWRIQRKVASHEFNSRTLRKFVDTAVKSEISGRLIPLLSGAAIADDGGKTVLDLQDVLQRFGFDNICKIAFGADPGLLDPTFPDPQFAGAFEDAVRLITLRFVAVAPIVWKIKRFFQIGTEKELREAQRVADEFAEKLIRDRRKLPMDNDNPDLLSRFMNYNNGDERFLKDTVTSFLVAGRDSTSVALTWFFFLVSGHKEVEEEILRELSGIGEELVGFEKVKEMHYLHAAICESMRLYPPVPFDSKQAIEDDVLPDGTFVKKGMRVMYHPYAMGRMESLWGKDWPDFRPERWLRREVPTGKWQFLPEDPYKFPVFQAGPRVCLGKEMAFVQMKSVASSVLRRFRLVPATPEFVPVYDSAMTARMKGGFPVRVELRIA